MPHVPPGVRPAGEPGQEQPPSSMPSESEPVIEDAMNWPDRIRGGMKNVSVRYALFFFTISIFTLGLVLLLGGLETGKELDSLQQRLAESTRKTFRKNELDMMKYLARLLRLSVYDPLQKGDLLHVNMLLANIKAGLPIDAVRIADITGTVVADGTEGTAAAAEFLNVPAEVATEGVWVDYAYDRAIVTFMIGGPGTHIGYGELVFPDKPMVAAVARQQQELGTIMLRLTERLSHVGLAAVAFTLLVALLLSVAMSRTLSRPLRLLRNAAERIAQNRMDEPIEVSTGDEVGDLATALNTMREQLQLQREEILQKNRERAETANDLEREVAERRRSEVALRESETRLRRLFEEGMDAGILLRLDGSVVDVNHRLLSNLRTTRETLVTGGLGRFMRRQDFDELVRLLSKANRTGRGTLESQASMQTGDGAVFDAAIQGGAVRLGSELMVFCTIRDISEKVDRYRVWAENMETLMQTDRTKFLGTAVSGFAYDVADPNRVIRDNTAYVQWIWNSLVPALEEYYAAHPDKSEGRFVWPDFHQYVATVLEDMDAASLRIDATLQGLMDYARDEKGETETVDVQRLIGDCIAMLGHRIGMETDELKVFPGEDIPPIRGNRRNLEQVVVNLVTNALESLEDREDAVTISTLWDRAEDRVVIVVEDEGIGMSLQEREKATEPFFTTKHASGAAGLGLSIAQACIREHKGDLTINSARGQGTRVEVSLPV